ncbi:MAG: glycogen/starch synthase [Pseudomonadota bacterium]
MNLQKIQMNICLNFLIRHGKRDKFLSLLLVLVSILSLSASVFSINPPHTIFNDPDYYEPFTQKAAPWKGTTIRLSMAFPEYTGIYRVAGLADAAKGYVEMTKLSSETVPGEMFMPGYTWFNADYGLAPSSFERTGIIIEVPVDYKTEDIPESFRNYVPRGPIVKFEVVKLQKDGVTFTFFNHLPERGEVNIFENTINPQAEDTSPRYTSLVEISHKPNEWIDRRLDVLAFGLLGKAQAIYVMDHMPNGDKPDLVMAHDWTTGMLVAFLRQIAEARGQKPIRTIGKVHNNSFQGLAELWLPRYLGVDSGYYSRGFGTNNGFEHFSQYEGNGIAFLKALYTMSTGVSSVSLNYMRESLDHRFGMSMDPFAQEARDNYRNTGLLNGVDVIDYNPAFPPPGTNFANHFSLSDLTAKQRIKLDVQGLLKVEIDGEIYGIEVNPEAPLVCAFNRLSDQKGFQFLPEAFIELLETTNAQFVIIGDGKKEYKDKLIEIMKAYPGRFFYGSFEQWGAPYERVITFGADASLVPSTFEPSGQTQTKAQSVATIPIGSNVGGLVDSIEDGHTGIIFKLHYEQESGLLDIDKTRRSFLQGFQRFLGVYESAEDLSEMRVNMLKLNHAWKDRVPLFEAEVRYFYENGPRIVRQSGGLPADRVYSPLELLNMLLRAKVSMADEESLLRGLYSISEEMNPVVRDREERAVICSGLFGGI